MKALIAALLITLVSVSAYASKECTNDGGQTIILVGDRYACPAGYYEI